MSEKYVDAQYFPLKQKRLIAHPHLLVRVTSERFLPTMVTSNGSH